MKLGGIIGKKCLYLPLPIWMVPSRPSTGHRNGIPVRKRAVVGISLGAILGGLFGMVLGGYLAWGAVFGQPEPHRGDGFGNLIEGPARGVRGIRTVVVSGFLGGLLGV